MTDRHRRRVADLAAAIDAISAHPGRGDLVDALVFDAVRMRLLEIGEAVKALPDDLLRTEPEVAWKEVARMRDHLVHRYFDTSHSILRATVEQDLPPLSSGVHRIGESLDAEGASGALDGR